MSESGSSRFPSPPNRIEPVQPSGRPEEHVLRLARLPEDLQHADRSIRLEGQVVDETRNREGEVTHVKIRTPRGDIDVETSRDRPAPRMGQSVEIEVRSGSPPQTAVVRPAPEARQASGGDGQTQVRIRRSETPVTIEVREGAAPRVQQGAQSVIQPPAAGTSQPATLPSAGSVVRLTAIPLRTLDTILMAPPSIEILQNTLNVIALEARLTLEPLMMRNPPAQGVALQTAVPVLQGAPLPLNIQPLPAGEVTALQNEAGGLPDIRLLSVAAFQVQESVLEFAQAGLAQPVEGQAPEPLTLPLQSESIFESFYPLSLPEASLVSASVTTETTAPALPEIMDAKIEGVRIPAVQVQTSGEPLSVAEHLAQAAREQTARPESMIVSGARAENIQAVIIGATESKLPVVSVFLARTGSGQVFALQAPTDSLVPGTQVTLTPHTPELSSSLSAVASLASFLAPAPWLLLNDIHQALLQLAPQLAQAMSSIAPQASQPGQLPPAMMLFIAAVRGGDLSGWLGDRVVNALRRGGRGDLLSRIGTESGLMGRGVEPASGDWRAMSLPLMMNNEFHKIALHYKQDDGRDENEGQGGKQTRFLFDLNLTAMGKVQIDGLYRGNRLDLILRTEEPFSKAMQADMRRTYTGAIGQTRLEGELSFQNDLSKWVTIDVQEDRFGVEA